MEGHRLRVQSETGGAGWSWVRRLLSVIKVEVDVAGGSVRSAAAVVHLKVVLQLKLRYGLRSEGTHTEGYVFYMRLMCVSCDLNP